MNRSEAYWILEEIRKESFSADYAEALGIAQETIEFVDLMPNDMVPVVRCKNCKHGLPCRDGYVRCSHPSGKVILMMSSDFCSYGERKDGDS